jgi:hypothetical protein
MGATVHLDKPIDGAQRIDCEEVKMMGEIVWATPADDAGERVIPISNVTGVDGDQVEQDIEEIEYQGGRMTKLVTRLS